MITEQQALEIAKEATNNDPIYCRQEFTFSRGQFLRALNLAAAMALDDLELKLWCSADGELVFLAANEYRNEATKK